MQRLTAHRLAELAFVRRKEMCPVASSRIIREVLSLPPLKWEERSSGLHNTDLLLPSGSSVRHAWVWARMIDPWTAWAWLNTLEETFLDAELEARFHAEDSAARIIYAFPILRIIIPVELAYLLLFVMPDVLRTNVRPPLRMHGRPLGWPQRLSRVHNGHSVAVHLAVHA